MTSKNNHYNILLQIIPILVLAVLIVFLASDKSITGNVSSDLNIEQEYPQNADIDGTLNINLFRGDLIPDTSNVTIYISSPRCKSYYFCQDGRNISWETYNYDTGNCEVITENPWSDCDESQQRNYSSCSPMDHVCCPVNQGLGNYYPNLPCASGECWDARSTGAQKSLAEALYLSGLGNTGNITYGSYNDMNGSGISGTGFGFAGC